MSTFSPKVFNEMDIHIDMNLNYLLSSFLFFRLLVGYMYMYRHHFTSMICIVRPKCTNMIDLISPPNLLVEFYVAYQRLTYLISNLHTKCQ